MNEEFGLHLEMRTEDLIRSGLSPGEAARRARLEFGSTERYRDEGRGSRGLYRIDALRFSWLDFKLGFRMLARYPGLTIVGGLAMAFAIWVGAGTFELAKTWIRPALPLPDGDRLVGIQLRDATTREVEGRALHDFVAWREELESVEDLSAFRTLERNLITSDGRGEPIEVAEISASAFRVARVAARLGRFLIEEDERAAAAPVIVIGYDVWEERFASDPDVIGKTVRLGNAMSTVVGVMPEGFAFPVSHDAWTPLRLNVLDYARRDGPVLRFVGRLAPGVSLGEAQSRLTSLGLRAAADFPDTHEHLRPQIMPYARSIVDLPVSELKGVMSLNVFVVMLLVLICANVALLMFARAATRESEIVVRNALGASRGRIIVQLFAEALVLGGISALVGLAAARYGVQWGLLVLEENLGRLPFWFDDTLSGMTLLYAVALTVLAAAIAGIVPALKVTRAVGVRMRQLTAGGGGVSFGGIWTVVIVAQVAVTVAFPATVFYVQSRMQPIQSIDVGFAAEQYLAVKLEMDWENSSGQPAYPSPSEFLAQFRRTYQELERRLEAEPAVAGVTFASRLPRMLHISRRIEIDDDPSESPDSIPGYPVNFATVDADYFDVLGAPIVSGRGFHPGDLGGRVVIVNQSFVDRVLDGRSPIGRRIRAAQVESGQEPHPWHEIIGVVKDLGMNYLGSTNDHGGAGFYQPLSQAAAAHPIYMAVHVNGDPESLGPRLRAVGNSVDPSLRFYDLQRLDQLHRGALRMIGIFLRVALLMSSVALVLALTGIYSVMSFTVSRRTREIGIRVALGADSRRVTLAIFSRPLAQVGLGVIAGAALVALLVHFVMDALSPRGIGLVMAYAAVMMAVCMLACIVPTRRALGVEPTDALREDG
jgi:predicted permease